MAPNPLLGTVFTIAAYVVGAFAFAWEARRRRVNTEGMLWVALFGAAVGAVCAKLGEELFGSGTVLVGGGRTILGGVAGGWIAVIIAKRALGLQRSTGDLWALALSSGEAVGRVGCFFHTCCFGATCALPWSVHQHGALRHPTQLYASAWCALLFVALWRLRTRLDEGALFPLYLLGWGAGRFAIEFFRAHDGATTGLSLAQWFSLGAMGAGLVLMARRARRRVEVRA